MNNLWTLNSLLPIMVFIPLAAALLSLSLTRLRWQLSFSLLFASLQVLAVFILIKAALNSPAPLELRYHLAAWGAPLGIDLALSGFALVMLAISAILNWVLCIYSGFYFNQTAVRSRFWPLWWLLMTGLNSLFLAADAFNLYVTLEIVALAAVALVALEGKHEALVAALRYLLVGLLGSLCYLLAVALLYHSYGTLDLSLLAGAVERNGVSGTALALISVGLLLKTALFPLHFWLPQAHANAAAPVSAILSALVIKASFYVLARFWLEILAPAANASGLQLLGVLGAAAVLVGSWRAWHAERLKLLVAYSTLAQLGYLFLLFPLTAPLLASIDTPQQASIVALQAVAYFIIAHALAKAAMFLAAGNILKAVGLDNLNHLQGLTRQQPISIFALAIAGVSLIGLPPSAGFIAKWLLLNVAIANQQWWWVLLLLTGSLLCALYVFRVLNLVFVPEKQQTTNESITSPSKATAHLSLALPICSLTLALLAVLLGFSAEWVLQIVGNYSVSTTALSSAIVSTAPSTGAGL